MLTTFSPLCLSWSCLDIIFSGPTNITKTYRGHFICGRREQTISQIGRITPIYLALDADFSSMQNVNVWAVEDYTKVQENKGSQSIVMFELLYGSHGRRPL